MLPLDLDTLSYLLCRCSVLIDSDTVFNHEGLAELSDVELLDSDMSSTFLRSSENIALTPDGRARYRRGRTRSPGCSHRVARRSFLSTVVDPDQTGGSCDMRCRPTPLANTGAITIMVYYQRIDHEDPWAKPSLPCHQVPSSSSPYLI